MDTPLTVMTTRAPSVPKINIIVGQFEIIMLANWPQSEAIPRAFQVGSEGQPHHHNDHIRTESRAAEVAKSAGPI